MNSRESRDERWMRLAVEEARKAEGRTRPNPPVGAVLVRDERLLATGFHKGAGHPHAEAEALAACAESPAGATAYVTLEPCSTQGRMPPCTEALKAAGITRVVVGALDANPKHAGRGIEILRAAGMEVITDVLPEITAELVAPFNFWVANNRPYITLKMAQSLDGAISDAQGESKWITGPEARREVQLLRSRVDAVMVGVGTLLADDPSLLCRLPNAGGELCRIIIDSRGRTPPTAQVLSDAEAGRTVIATTSACPPSASEAWRTMGGRVWTLPQDMEGRVDLHALAARMGAEGWLHVLCEGGATLAGALVSARLVNRMLLFVAPMVLGARRQSTFGAQPFVLSDAPRFKILDTRQYGEDILLSAEPR